jgi:hypothetical protein
MTAQKPKPVLRLMLFSFFFLLHFFFKKILLFEILCPIFDIQKKGAKAFRLKAKVLNLVNGKKTSEKEQLFFRGLLHVFCQEVNKYTFLA